MRQPHDRTPGPPPVAPDGRPEFLVTLGVLLPCSPEDVKQAYLAKAKLMHPDAGGSIEQFKELQTAYERALEFTKFHAGRSRWLADSVERYVEQEEVASEIRRRGGRAEMAHPDWLKREIGEDFAQVLDTIVGVRFNEERFGDADIEYLISRPRAFDTLEWVDLRRSRVTNSGLAKLLALPGLRKLDLRNTQIGNAGVKAIRELPRLEWLGLSESRVNWFGRWRLRRIRPDVAVA